jgi:hypothetical protein
LLRYGVTNPSKADIIKDRIKESFNVKYGEGITNAMNKEKITELKKELTEEEKIKLLQEGIKILDRMKKNTDEAYIRKQNEISRNNKT